MSTSDIERIFDLTRIKKSLRRWRIFGVLVVLAGIAAALAANHDWTKSRDHIARLHIDGVITGDAATLNLVRAVASADHAKALIVSIDSPGGTTVGSEALYEELRKIAKVKPVVAVMKSVAASGGYITAIAADHIVARGNTITGSIGVIFSFPEVSKLLDTIGVKMEEVKSAELKAEPTPYKPMSDHVRSVTNEMVQEAFGWFVDLVAERRNLKRDQALVLADGRVYSGRQAVKNGLIDELGGDEQAVTWLEDERSIAKDLAIVDWRPAADSNFGFGFSASSMILRALGLEKLAGMVETARLDGLLVLWHPQL
jgi:protease-4